MRRLFKSKCGTNLVFIHIKTEQCVIDSVYSDYFSIDFCIQAFQTNKFSRPKNKKTYLKNKLSVIDIQLEEPSKHTNCTVIKY